LVVTLSELFDRGERDSAGRLRTDNSKVREFWRQNALAGQNLQEKILPKLKELAPAGIIELPVLFHESALPGVGVGSAAFTPNLVNGHVFGKTFLMPKAFVSPRGVGNANEPAPDLFEDAAARALSAGGLALQFVDNYFLFHNSLGEVHCALNLILEPPIERPHWWEPGPGPAGNASLSFPSPRRR
jgi:hypothetical protein